MEQNKNIVRSEAATDEPASSVNRDSDGAAAAPAGCDAGEAAAFAVLAQERDHKPPDWDRDLSCASAAPPLTRAELLAGYRPVETDSLGRAIRGDGFTPDRQRIFLAVLAACGIVADACRAAGISKDTAYNLRNRAEGRAFAIAWNAALLIARGRMDDELMSRAMNGVVERIYRNGELWGERHRHDNRLAMAMLTRLDKQAEGMGEGAATARIAAQEWDQFLDIVEAGGDGVERFLSKRARIATMEPPADDPETPEAGGEVALLARLRNYRDWGAGLPTEVDIEDLDPEEMEAWTEDQWDRAEHWGLLDLIGEDEWPEIARKVTESETNGNRPIRQDVATGHARVRAEYFLRFPPGDSEAEEPVDAWEDEDLECWVTGYPPPEGFEGYEEGEWGEEDYRRALSPREQAAIDAGLEAGRAEDEAERDATLEAARAARDRAFGFAGDRAELPVVSGASLPQAEIEAGDPPGTAE